MDRKKKRYESEREARQEDIQNKGEQVEEEKEPLEEAIEDNPEIVGIEERLESEPEGEDLMENMEADYELRENLDKYAPESADEEEANLINIEERKEAERELNERDYGKMVNRSRMPAALIDMYNAENEEEMQEAIRTHQKMRWKEDEEEMEGIEAGGMDYEDIKGNPADWINNPRHREKIKKSFAYMLRSYKTEEDDYERRINKMCAEQKQSLEVNYSHMSAMIPSIALWTAEIPAQILPLLNEVATELVLEKYPEYYVIHREIYVKIVDLPVEDKLRDLRQTHLTGLVKISGVVTKRSAIYPQLQMAVYSCKVCNSSKGPFFFAFPRDVNLGTCVCGSRSFALNPGKTIYKNYQKITIQETPGSVPPGRVPRQKDILLLNDNIDCARPGDEVEVTGIYQHHFDYGMNIKHCFPVFSTGIEANYVKRCGQIEKNLLTDEDTLKLRHLSKRADIQERIFASMAPSIYGHKFIKRALALAIFGGVPQDIEGKHRVRGDINVLLLGDPSTAKSQFLKFVEKAAHRCVYTTGKGASAVGLTAGVRKDPMTREWVLEGGALVLADKGICIIDEFDKMNDQDRTSIHEAMEQQSISISKAGIVTTARCSVIAAANPLKGKYDPQLSFNENIDLTDPILSRFDVLAVIKDEVDETKDRDMATFVINSHIKCHPNAESGTCELLTEPEVKIEPLPQEILKKYVAYAKSLAPPKLSDIDINKLTNFYKQLRREALAVGGLPVGVRHLESVIRMSEAFAKMELRDHVTNTDTDAAIKMMLESFLMTQKSSVQKALQREFNKYITRGEDFYTFLESTITRMIAERHDFLSNKRFMAKLPPLDKREITITKSSFEEEARKFNVTDVDKFLRSAMFSSKFQMKDNLIKLK